MTAQQRHRQHRWLSRPRLLHRRDPGTCRAVADRITATLGVDARALSDEPIGPHPVPQFRFTFTTAQFDTIVPWLMFNRQGLDVLVHPLTDSSSTTTVGMRSGSARRWRSSSTACAATALSSIRRAEAAHGRGSGGVPRPAPASGREPPPSPRGKTAKALLMVGQARQSPCRRPEPRRDTRRGNRHRRSDA